MSVHMGPMQVKYDLISLIDKKEEHAFTILYRRYWPSLLAFAGNFIADRDTCQEIVQQLFIQLHLKRPQLRTSTSLIAYLHSCLRNKILNHLRDQSVYNKHIRIAYSAGRTSSNNDNNIDQFMGMSALNAEIAGCLRNMPVKYREVYVLHEHYQLTLKKTAEVLNRPLDTVGKQYRKAVHLLRDHLVKHEISLASN